jgi:hypothetical protein
VVVAASIDNSHQSSIGSQRFSRGTTWTDSDRRQIVDADLRDWGAYPFFGCEFRQCADYASLKGTCRLQGVRTPLDFKDVFFGFEDS